MKYLTILLVLPIIFLSSCSKSPDTIYINGKIYTLDKSNTVSEAIAVKENTIFDIGKTEDLKSKYSSAKVVDLQGKTVIPGFIDMEGSVVEFSKNLNFINLVNAKSVDEILNLVAERSKSMKPDSWLGGFGWNDLNLPEEDLLKMHRSLIDKIAPDINVYLVNITSSAVWCNSKLLKTLNIDENTKSPENGEIEKDDDGKLTGLLYDSAINLVKNNTPDFSRNDMKDFLAKGSAELLKYGITGVHDKTVTTETLNLIKELIDEGNFSTRLYGILSAEDNSFDEYLKKGIEKDYKNKLTVRAVSIDYDGSVELQSAFMSDDYIQEPKKQQPYASDSLVEAIYQKASGKDFQFIVKAVGDKAIKNNLNTISKLYDGGKKQRTVMEYVEFAAPEDIMKMKELKIIPSIRPEITINTLSVLKEKLPESNKSKIRKWKNILDETGIIVTGSNFPYNLINPFYQIYILVSGRTPFSEAKEHEGILSLNILDAVKSYTIWAAYAGFEEDIKGSLEKNKIADFIVLSDDIFNVNIEKIPDIKVVKTIFDGKVVYELKD